MSSSDTDGLLTKCFVRSNVSYSYKAVLVVTEATLDMTSFLRTDIDDYTKLYTTKGWKTRLDDTMNRKIQRCDTQKFIAKLWASADTLA